MSCLHLVYPRKRIQRLWERYVPFTQTKSVSGRLTGYVWQADLVLSIVPDSLEGLGQHARSDPAYHVLATIPGELQGLTKCEIANPEIRPPCASSAPEHELVPDSLIYISPPSPYPSHVSPPNQEATGHTVRLAEPNSVDKQSVQAIPTKKSDHPQEHLTSPGDPFHAHGGQSSPAALHEHPTSTPIKEETRDLGIDVATSSRESFRSSLGKRRRSRHGKC